MELNRFFDLGTLKYALRSVEKYANWVRHIFIVTNGQVPNWLKQNQSRITVVTHEVTLEWSKSSWNKAKKFLTNGIKGMPKTFDRITHETKHKLLTSWNLISYAVGVSWARCIEQDYVFSGCRFEYDWGRDSLDHHIHLLYTVTCKCKREQEVITEYDEDGKMFEWRQFTPYCQIVP